MRFSLLCILVVVHAACAVPDSPPLTAMQPAPVLLWNASLNATFRPSAAVPINVFPILSLSPLVLVLENAFLSVMHAGNGQLMAGPVNITAQFWTHYQQHNVRVQLFSPAAHKVVAVVGTCGSTVGFALPSLVQLWEEDRPSNGCVSTYPSLPHGVSANRVLTVGRVTVTLANNITTLDVSTGQKTTGFTIKGYIGVFGFDGNSRVLAVSSQARNRTRVVVCYDA